MEGIRTPEFKKELEVAKSIALKAGEIMLKYYDVNVDQQVEAKADQSRVTIADKEINRFVIEELARHFPSDAVIGEEESTGEYGMGRRWICDPVDGTESFIARAGRSMFSLGLVIDGKPVLGVALNPVTGKLFEATKNHGSYCNGERINVSKNIEGGQVGVSDKVRKAATPPEYVKKLVGFGFEPMSFNGAVNKACLVASGEFVGNLQVSAKNYDIAAAHIIVEEAGGKVTGYDGRELDYSRPFRSAIISNGLVHEKLMECIKE